MPPTEHPAAASAPSAFQAAQAHLETETSQAPDASDRPVETDQRLSVVVITRDRRSELLRSLELLCALRPRPKILVVDNGSTDGTSAAVRSSRLPVELISLDANLGAVGRNIAVRRVRTPYVAFCDDDTWWDPGALGRAADILDAHLGTASVTARILVEPGGREDPIVAELRDSPVEPAPGQPGPALGSILAGASMLRVDAFRAVGGFHPRIWLGGEEELLAADLMAAGWSLCFAEDVTVRHAPSTARDSTVRRRLGIRNTLWFLGLRRPWPDALRAGWALAARVPKDVHSLRAFAAAALGIGWVLRERRVVPPRVEQAYRALEHSQRTSTARRYVG
jgi:GT2 family glycosyltransferase